MDRGEGLYVEEFGTGAPVLMLLHGQGATGDVWNGLRALASRGWRGRCVVPDLRGHGRSAHRLPYAYGTYAADVAALIGLEEEAVVVGHSLGGAVALTLASGWFGVRLRHIIAFGVKVTWSDEELARRRKLAEAPVRWFETRAEAVERFLKVSGQFGLVDPASSAAASGIVAESGRFRLAADPRISGGSAPEIGAIHRAATAPVTMAVGSDDPMLPVAEARSLDSSTVILPGVGHNAHVERPDLIWALIEGKDA